MSLLVPKTSIACSCLIAFSWAVHAAAPGIDEGRKHWAFQPLSTAPAPVVKDGTWAKNEVDRFVLAKLEAAKLKPSAEADRVTLIRRVTFDLIGLPPTPKQVAAFVSDESPQAWERVIDRLLQSPQYGERWGRHWLDLARYADTGGVHNDLDRPYAWKYRDYVIKSFNDDKPYARFVAEQLAGDEVEGAGDETLIATGFCRNGQSNDDNMGKTPEALAQYRADQLDDVISTTGSVFLGLTVGCARCHDHKTDPLLQKDYYSLMAIFNGTEKVGLGKGAKDANDKDVKEASKVMALVEKSPSVPTTRVLLRGLAANKGDEVSAAVPVVLGELAFPKAGENTSLRRRTLAEWIVSPQNPLSWRVLANRVWQHHFGAGIVVTPSNFGFQGARPTHPELLDYLAAQLITNGGHLKPLHKLILMSATYRQSSDASRSDAATVDPTNTMLWRMNKQRMEAEVLRDSVLATSGKLNLQAGGPGFKPRLRPDLLDASQRNKWPLLTHEGSSEWRRSVYIYVKRQLLMPSMELFDAPTTTDSCALRMTSTVPTQALVMMNDEFVEEQARFLAGRAMHDADNDLPKAIERMFKLALARVPTEQRMQQSLDFVKAQEKASDQLTAMTDLAHVLLNSSEFITIE